MDSPRYRERENVQKFLKDVEAYFTELLDMPFRMRTFSTSANSPTAEYFTCGSIFVLFGPMYGDEEGYTNLKETQKAFVLRELEKIFDTEGAYCWEQPYWGHLSGKTFHYQFRIWLKSNSATSPSI